MWCRGINLSFIKGTSLPLKSPAVPCSFYLGDGLVFNFPYSFFSWGKTSGLQNFGRWTMGRFFTFCCIRHFSCFSDSAVPFLGALEQLKYQPAEDHPVLSECTDGNVWWFQITRLQGLHPFPEGAASAHWQWHSSCASLPGVPFVNRQSPYKAGKQQKCWHPIVIPWHFSSKNRKHRGINNTWKKKSKPPTVKI